MKLFKILILLIIAPFLLEAQIPGPVTGSPSNRGEVRTFGTRIDILGITGVTDSTHLIDIRVSDYGRRGYTADSIAVNQYLWDQECSRYLIDSVGTVSGSNDELVTVKVLELLGVTTAPIRGPGAVMEESNYPIIIPGLPQQMQFCIDDFFKNTISTDVDTLSKYLTFDNISALNSQKSLIRDNQVIRLRSNGHEYRTSTTNLTLYTSSYPSDTSAVIPISGSKWLVIQPDKSGVYPFSSFGATNNGFVDDDGNAFRKANQFVAARNALNLGETIIDFEANAFYKIDTIYNPTLIFALADSCTWRGNNSTVFVTPYDATSTSLVYTIFDSSEGREITFKDFKFISNGKFQGVRSIQEAGDPGWDDENRSSNIAIFDFNESIDDVRSGVANKGITLENITFDTIYYPIRTGGRDFKISDIKVNNAKDAIRLYNTFNFDIQNVSVHYDSLPTTNFKHKALYAQDAFNGKFDGLRASGDLNVPIRANRVSITRDSCNALFTNFQLNEVGQIQFAEGAWIADGWTITNPTYEGQTSAFVLDIYGGTENAMPVFKNININNSDPNMTALIGSTGGTARGRFENITISGPASFNPNNSIGLLYLKNITFNNPLESSTFPVTTIFATNGDHGGRIMLEDITINTEDEGTNNPRIIRNTTSDVRVNRMHINDTGDTDFFWMFKQDDPTGYIRIYNSDFRGVSYDDFADFDGGATEANMPLNNVYLNDGTYILNDVYDAGVRKATDLTGLDGSGSLTETDYLAGYATDATGTNTRMVEVDLTNPFGGSNNIRSIVDTLNRYKIYTKGHLNPVDLAINTKKSLVINDTLIISGNLDLQNVDVEFTKNGFIQGADTITASGATIQADPNKQLWSNSTVITGEWAVEKAYLEWTIGGVKNDYVNNFLALTNAHIIGNRVELTKSFPIETLDAGTSFITEKDINILGIGDSAELVLHTAHNNLQSYFKSHTGSNFSLNNISITSEDYINGVSTASNKYKFYNNSYHVTLSPTTTSYNLRNVIVKECNINGDIIIHEAGINTSISITDYRNVYIDNFELINNNCREIHRAFATGNIPIKKYNVTGNNIFQVYSNLHFWVVSGLSTDQSARKDSLDGIAYFNNNYVKNTQLVTTNSGTYLGLAVVECDKVIALNNRFYDIRTDNSSIALYPIYTSDADEFQFNDNIVSGCIGAATSGNITSLMFLKESSVTMHNNEFLVSENDFLQAGLIDSITQNKSDYNFNLNLFNRGVFYDTLDRSNITDNTFSTPYLTNSSTLNFDQLIFTDNILNIGYVKEVSSTALTKGCTLFFNKKDNGAVGYRESKKVINYNNNIIIDNTDCDSIIIIQHPDNELYSSPSQLRSNWNVTVNKNDSLSIINSVLRGEVVYENINLNKGNISIKNQNINISNTESYLRKDINNNYNIGEYTYLLNSNGFISYRDQGVVNVSINKMKDDSLSIMNIIRQELLYNPKISDTIPFLLKIKLEAKDTLSKVIRKEFRLVLNHNPSNPAFAYNNMYLLDNTLTPLSQDLNGNDYLRNYAVIGDTAISPQMRITQTGSASTRENRVKLGGLMGYTNIKLILEADEKNFQAGTSLIDKTNFVATFMSRKDEEYYTNILNGVDQLNTGVSGLDIIGNVTIQGELTNLDSLKWEHKFPSNGDTILLESYATRLHLGPGDSVYIDESPLAKDALLSVIQSSGMSTVLKTDGASNRFYQAGVNNNTWKTYGTGSVKTFIYNVATNHWNIYNDHKEDVTLFTDYSAYQAAITPYPNEMIRYDALTSAGTTTISTDNLLQYQKFYIEIVNADTNPVTLDHATGGFIRGSVNGDFSPDTTETFSGAYHSLILIWDGTDFTIRE